MSYFALTHKFDHVTYRFYMHVVRPADQRSFVQTHNPSCGSREKNNKNNERENHTFIVSVAFCMHVINSVREKWLGAKD